MRDLTDAAFGRQIRRIEPIDPAHARVGRDQLIGKLRERFQIASFFGARLRGGCNFFSSPGFAGAFLSPAAFLSSASFSFGALSNALISAGGSNIPSGTL